MSVLNEREEDASEHKDPKLEGDWCNVLLLTFIYLLQSIPRGLSFATPLILQERKVTYTDQVSDVV